MWLWHCDIFFIIWKVSTANLIGTSGVFSSRHRTNLPRYKICLVSIHCNMESISPHYELFRWDLLCNHAKWIKWFKHEYYWKSLLQYCDTFDQCISLISAFGRFDTLCGLTFSKTWPFYLKSTHQEVYLIKLYRLTSRQLEITLSVARSSDIFTQFAYLLIFNSALGEKKIHMCKKAFFLLTPEDVTTYNIMYHGTQYSKKPESFVSSFLWNLWPNWSWIHN